MGPFFPKVLHVFALITVSVLATGMLGDRIANVLSGMRLISLSMSCLLILYLFLSGRGESEPNIQCSDIIGKKYFNALRTGI
jgi:hypothetical protein